MQRPIHEEDDTATATEHGPTDTGKEPEAYRIIGAARGVAGKGSEGPQSEHQNLGMGSRLSFWNQLKSELRHFWLGEHRYGEWIFMYETELFYDYHKVEVVKRQCLDCFHIETRRDYFEHGNFTGSVYNDRFHV